MSKRFTEDQISAIRTARHNGATASALAAEFGVKQPTISNICNGVTYASMPFPSGQPPKNADQVAADLRRRLAPRVISLVGGGMSYRATAAQLGVSYTLVRRIHRDSLDTE